MKIRLTAVSCSAALLVWAAPTAAHHSFAAQYDAKRPVEKKGTVSKVEWTNPHARFYVDVKNEKGEIVESWNFELASPNVLVRNGWKRTTLKIGEPVTVAGYLARSGPPSGPRMAIASAVIASDGTNLFASAPEDLPR